MTRRCGREALCHALGRYRNPFTDDPTVQGKDRNLANTTPLVFNGQLFVLREDSPPVKLDPLTLETLGNYDFGGTLTRVATWTM